MTERIATREAYGKALAELGERNADIVALDSDLSKSTKSSEFAKRFPHRFFQMGVAEANMVNTAAGLAACGKIPFTSTFAIFATGRAWEQVRNTVGYGGLNVTIVGSHGGITVGEDGSSHQAIEDITIMRAIPGMTILVPCDGIETRKAVFAAAEWSGPVYLRTGRSAVPIVTDESTPFTIGEAVVLRDGTDVALVACGIMVAAALEAAEQLEAEGLNAAVIDLHTIKPTDAKTLTEFAQKCGAIVTCEEHVLQGGMGSAVAECVVKSFPVPIEMIGIDNRFGQSGSSGDLLKEYSLTPNDIFRAAKRAIGRKSAR